MRDNDWHDPRWRAEAHTWITARLADRGTRITGPIDEFRVRPWSVTHRVPTTIGTTWFKANITACRYEAGLANALTHLVPGSTLPPLAVDTTRGWLLTADAGPTLRETLAPADRPRVWAAMLQKYAALQRSTAPHTPELLALGVPDLSVPSLPGHLAALSNRPSPSSDSHDRAIAPDVDPKLVREFTEWCTELDDDGIPAALQHDDLHDGNVFADLTFFDWGDASIAHPFGSLLVALNVMQDTLEVPNGAAELLRLRDAYLEPWSDLASPATLRRSVSLACRVTRVSRAMAWQRALTGAAVPVDEAFRTAPEAWLAELPTEPAV